MCLGKVEKVRIGEVRVSEDRRGTGLGLHTSLSSRSASNSTLMRSSSSPLSGSAVIVDDNKRSRRNNEERGQ